jgi:opine dehydrogenase
MEIRSVAVLGAGNGGCAAAADLTDRGYEVRLYNRSRRRLDPLIERGGISMVGIRTVYAPVALITGDLRQAVEGADLVMLAVPVSAHPYYAAALAELLEPEQVVFLNPGHMGGGLFVVAEIHRRTGRTDVRTCEVTTLSYVCRMADEATVNVLQTVSNLSFAAFPGRHQSGLFDALRRLYPALVEASSVLETGFLDINAVEHPPQTVCNAGWVERTRGQYLFYYEGTTPAVGRVIDAVDRERMAIARAANVPTRPFVETFFRTGYTTESAMRTGSAYAALQASEPNRWIKGPPSLDHRYLHEDVGFALVPWSQMGRALGVPTPTIDTLIALASTLNGVDYRSEGLTLERLGLAGRDLRALGDFLERGPGA